MRERVQWIDCAKAVAMFAVILLHCKGTLYTSPYISQLTYWCVCVFIILSGMTAYLSTDKKREEDNKTFDIKRVGKLLFQYIIASTICSIYYERGLNIPALLKNLVCFDASAPFYFFAFYFQLMIITPALYRLLKYCVHHKWGILLNLLTVTGMFIFGILSIQFTYITPTFGGGEYLLGGSYLFLFYCGMLFSTRNMYIDCLRGMKQITLKVIIGIVSMTGCLILWLNLAEQRLEYRTIGYHLFGDGVNPPGILLMLYAFLVFLSLYCIFSLLCECKGKAIQRVIELMSKYGRHTLYVFMYHCLIRDFVMKFDFIPLPVWLFYAILFMLMLFGPLIIEVILTKTKILFLSCYQQGKEE